MKEITINIFNQSTDLDNTPKKADHILESSYRILDNPKMILAVRKAIKTLIEKIEGESIEWIEEYIEKLIQTSEPHSFSINNRFYMISF